MTAAVPLWNVVGVANDVFLIRVIPLHRDFQRNAVSFAVVKKRFFVNCRTVFIHKRHILAQAAVKPKLFAPFVTLISQHHGQTGIQKRQLAQAARQNVAVNGDIAKNFGVRQKGDFGPALVNLALFRQRRGGLAAGKRHLMNRAVPPYCQ